MNCSFSLNVSLDFDFLEEEGCIRATTKGGDMTTKSDLPDPIDSVGGRNCGSLTSFLRGNERLIFPARGSNGNDRGNGRSSHRPFRRVSRTRQLEIPTSTSKRALAITLAILGVVGLTMMPVALVSSPASATSLGNVLILGTSVTGGSSSAEAAVVTADGYTPVVDTGTTWDGLTQSQFSSYSAVILGDPTCSTSASGPRVHPGGLLRHSSNSPSHLSTTHEAEPSIGCNFAGSFLARQPVYGREHRELAVHISNKRSTMQAPTAVPSPTDCVPDRARSTGSS